MDQLHTTNIGQVVREDPHPKKSNEYVVMEINTILVDVYSYTYQRTALTDTTDSLDKQPLCHVIPIKMKHNTPLTPSITPSGCEKDTTFIKKADKKCRKSAANLEKELILFSKLTFKCRKYAANFRKVMFLMKFQKQNARKFAANVYPKNKKILHIQIGTALHIMTAELF